ncbi:glycosyltransferase family 4 protein [Sediminibacterium goheungense]|uniref:Glycosyl transferase family 1 n=1 Tax=Sediminibacterium goheungense TaxID=1086393 RepID=A0A4R6IZD5_9BACT|nr:glycosyltransferase family 4 protein [Sediminibacterium goheungense]TDO28249.1 glycosyl transferase family 1 [Sediminibacterium goheungense]
MLKRIIFTVTNDLSYDQRMQRICDTLASNGYQVLLVGRKRKDAIPLTKQAFDQRRIFCFWNKGPLFYVEYNIRLLLFLLTNRADIVCAIDLDTVLPCYFSSIIKKQIRVYDAHELFTEQFEVVRRPGIHRIWLWIEKFAVKRFKYGYTVNEFISNWLQQQYDIQYDIIRNLPVEYSLTDVEKNKFILYQGSVNEGRCFDTLVPAMRDVIAPLVICGKGNYFEETQKLIKHYHLENKIECKGYLTPLALRETTQQAYIGLTLFDQKGLNQYQSLANRFFDYMMAGIPQICVNYPEYKRINDEFGFALMIDNTDSQSIAAALNNLLADSVLYEKLQQNALKARSVLNWEQESQKLIRFYNSLP